jgi:hypothetical protein
LPESAVTPHQFWPEHDSPLFSSCPDKTLAIAYAEEISHDWLFFLEKKQYQVHEEIFERILAHWAGVHRILGGPGTGNTCILLNLLKLLVDSECKVAMELSDELMAYVERSTQLGLAPLPSMLSDRDLGAIAEDPHTIMHWLDICYRQKTNVGKAAKQVMDVVAASTPFRAPRKVQAFRGSHESITGRANNLSFVNPYGYVQQYAAATAKDIVHELNRILARESILWTHCPSVLLLLIDCSLSPFRTFACQALFGPFAIFGSQLNKGT